MAYSICVLTDFDCRPTGVTGHFRTNVLPFVDRLDQSITNFDSWNSSRNQQRNWETILQLIGLYTQPQSISDIRMKNGRWEFEFETEFDDVFRLNEDPVGLLKQACRGVPIINYVQQQLTALLQPDVNIWFYPKGHK
jgi:hypothetical protein